MMKILITVGPVSNDESVLKFFSTKTGLFRLNGSHGTLEWHRKTVNSIRKVCPNSFILMDIPGVKPRTNNLENIRIDKGQEVIFGDAPLGEQRLSLELTKALPKHDASLTDFSVNDGQFAFEFINCGDGFVVGRSRSDFTLLPRKGVNLPNSIYNEVQQAKIYKK